MATLIQSWNGPQLIPTSPAAESWYAVQTYARHEKMVEHRLQERGVTTFLPLMTEVHRWSDRKQIVQVPLFGCYVFAKIAATNVERLRVLRVEGVLSLVGSGREGTPIPDHEIESVRILLARASTVEFPPIPEDRTACPHSERSTGWHGGCSCVAQRRSHSGDQRGGDSAVVGGPRRRIRSRSSLT